MLGPFLTADAHHIEEGGSIASEGSGEYFLVQGRVTDREGNGIAGAEIVRPHILSMRHLVDITWRLQETWETDADGFYDV